jgi:hypothetical protein
MPAWGWPLSFKNDLLEFTYLCYDKMCGPINFVDYVGLACVRGEFRSQKREIIFEMTTWWNMKMGVTDFDRPDKFLLHHLIETWQPGSQPKEIATLVAWSPGLPLPHKPRRPPLPSSPWPQA